MSLLERLVPVAGDVLVGRYLLVEELGRGGFGVVYRAKQKRLDEDVALKIVLPHVATNPDLSQRFQREVAVAKGLRHPNSIRVRDVSETSSGLPFYVMEYVDGWSLGEMLHAMGPTSPRRAAHIAIQVLKSLAEAHSRGVVHRDLKPGNIMLCDIFGERDFVKVLDFGIAKALTGGDGLIYQTETGMILGTPAYMSPEQGRAQRDIDGRADLYSVGLILSECLTGETVVVGDTPYSVISQHVSRSSLSLHPTISGTPLGEVVRRATEKRRRDRYDNASQMRAAIEALEPDLESCPLVSRHRPLPVPRTPPFQPAAELCPETPPLPGVPQAVIGIADHNAKTLLARRRRLVSGRWGWWRSRAGVISTTIAVAGISALVALLAVLRGGEDLKSSAPPVDEAVAGSGSSPTEQSDKADKAKNPWEDWLSTANSEQEPSTLGSDPRLSAATALAVAMDRVRGSVPLTQRVRFEGTPRMTVRLGAAELGETPFEGLFPRVRMSLEMHFERPRYRARTEQVSLWDPVVSVRLRRQPRTAEAEGALAPLRDENGSLSDAAMTPF